MSGITTLRDRGRALAVVVAGLALMACPLSRALAENPLGLYVGGAVGQARIDVSAPYVSDFRENHSVYKVMVGLRPISLIGAELAYIDFGHPGRVDGVFSTDVTMKGTAAFGMLFLPLPAVDLYAKAGVARLESAISTAIVCRPSIPCPAIATPGPVNRTNVGVAAGAGAQLKLGSWAVRAEYERFNAAGGNPGLVSAGFTWSFF
jgi:opacity protein-like surface antigen